MAKDQGGEAASDGELRGQPACVAASVVPQRPALDLKCRARAPIVAADKAHYNKFFQVKNKSFR
jgi:hypothetical protein